MARNTTLGTVMRSLICLSLLALPATASAEGLCENLTDEVEVLAFSGQLGQIAIHRTREICTETDDMHEERHTFDFVQFVDAKGAVLKTVNSHPDDHVALKRHIAADTLPHASLKALMATGGFTARPGAQASTNGTCEVTLGREAPEGVAGASEQFNLLLTVTDASKASHLINLGEAEAYAPFKTSGRTWFFPEARVVVAEWKVPSLHGPTAPDGSFKAEQVEGSAWGVYGTSDLKALANCFPKSTLPPASKVSP